METVAHLAGSGVGTLPWYSSSLTVSTRLRAMLAVRDDQTHQTLVLTGAVGGR